MIEIKNLDEVKNFLENLAKAKKENSKEALIKAASFIQSEVKASIAGRRAELTSVNTGRFLNSVDIKKGEELEVIIFTDVPYAKFLEYGTSKIEPRAHFSNTVTRIKKDVRDIISQNI